MRTVIVGGTALVRGSLATVEVAVDGDRFGEQTGGSARIVDASGLLILPGIIDLHADAFERALEPRPGVRVPIGVALAEHDGWLLAAGITTCFLSLTDGFEPGLRSRQTVRAVLDALGGARLSARLPLHLRREVCADGDADELVAWMAAGRIGLLSTADHLPADDDDRSHARFIASLRRRLNGQGAEIERLVAEARARRADGLRLRDRLCAAAQAAGIPLASHDDATPAQAEASAARGVAICEFPADLPAARSARRHGASVLMGAPNALRGGSHIGSLGAAEAVSAGVCDALCSDYHHPSLLHAAFALAARGSCPLPVAWHLVSAGPAAAAGLHDRGRIAPGLLADLVLVEPGPVPRVRGVWVGGREVARCA
jgi:alpha-D-ribose 1-methylphosphonate 5-triphosphate diphosphatase